MMALMMYSGCTSSLLVGLHIAALHYSKLLRKIFDGAFHEAPFPALRNTTKRGCCALLAKRCVNG